MDDQQIINQRQFAWLTASIITSGGMISLQNVLIRINEMDAWFCYLLPIFYVFLIAAFFACLNKYFPQKNLFEISMLLLGPWGGRCLNVIILFHCWMIVISDVSSFSKFTSTILLVNTPQEVIILLTCLLLLYFGRGSLEVIVRVNDIFYPLFVISLLFMPLLLTNEMSFGLLHPILTVQPMHLGYGNFLAVGGVSDVFMLGAFMHTFLNTKQLRSSIRHGSMVGICILSMMTFLEVIVFGPRMPGNFLYPTYNLVQMIHVTDFLDRLDLIMLLIWFPTITCKILAVYLALLIGVSSLLKERNYTVINKPMALFIAMTSWLAFKSTTEQFSFINFSSPIILLSYQPLVMLIVLIALKLYKQKHSISEPQQEKHSPKIPNKDAAAKHLYLRLSYSTWKWSGNWTAVAALLFIASGLLFSMNRPLVGTINAILYILCLIVIFVTTYMELQQSIQPKAK